LQNGQLIDGANNYTQRSACKCKYRLPQTITSSKRATMENNQKDINKKIVEGLEKAYQKLLEFKKQKQTDLVVLQDNKVVRIKPN